MIRLLAWCLVAMVGFAARALAAPPVVYNVDLTDARSQVVRVSATFRGVGDTLDLHLPVWRPGLYQILDPAGTIRELRAVGLADASAPTPLDVAKPRTSHWRVSTAGQGTVRVEYTVWAASLDNRTRHADDTHAYLSPSTVFLYAQEWRDAPVEVRMRTPAGWRVSSGMDADAAAEPGVTVLRAASYDVLADSPIEAGLHELIRFDVEGVPHEVVVWSGAAPADPPPPGDFRASERYRKMPADFAAIAREQREIFGDLPYSRYVFMLHVYPGGRGGTEHLNSTIMQVSPEAFATDEAYTRLLSLTSHEVFHTWNVKRFRPSSMTPYNYQGESDTSLLWLVEGTTSYYEDLVLVRAGLIKPDEFLKTLAKMIGELRARPGARVQSVADAGADAWIKFNRRTADATNSQVSFYDKGALVSLLLDLSIRDRTAGRASLDDLMRALDRDYGGRTGYTEADVRRLLGQIVGAGPDAFDDFFTTAIRGTETLPFEPAPASRSPARRNPRSPRWASRFRIPAGWPRWRRSRPTGPPRPPESSREIWSSRSTVGVSAPTRGTKPSSDGPSPSVSDLRSSATTCSESSMSSSPHGPREIGRSPAPRTPTIRAERPTRHGWACRGPTTRP